MVAMTVLPLSLVSTFIVLLLLIFDVICILQARVWQIDSSDMLPLVYLRRQILDTRIQDEETRRTNRERFSRTLKWPFWGILRMLDS
jgi:hypothetical protein